MVLEKPLGVGAREAEARSVSFWGLVGIADGAGGAPTQEASLEDEADASCLSFNVYNVVKAMIKRCPSKLLTYLI